MLHFVHFKQFTTNSALWGIKHLKPTVVAETSNCNLFIRAMAMLEAWKILQKLLNIPISFFFPKKHTLFLVKAEHKPTKQGKADIRIVHTCLVSVFYKGY